MALREALNLHTSCSEPWATPQRPSRHVSHRGICVDFHPRRPPYPWLVLPTAYIPKSRGEGSISSAEGSGVLEVNSINNTNLDIFLF